MINLFFINECDKQFIQFKHALRLVVRAIVEKGMSRMYPFIFGQTIEKNLLSEVLKTNLTNEQFEMINALLKSFIEPINKIVQEFIDAEVEAFKNEHPEAELKEVAKYRRNTHLGTIDLKVPVFRKAEFKSIIIKSKCRNFFTETLMLAMIIANGSMSYDGIKTFFKNFGVKITNQEISNITKIVNAYKNQIIKAHNESINPHQLVVFIDGVWIKYKEPKTLINKYTGEVITKKQVVKKVVLNAIGIDVNGKKRTLGSVICDHENSEAYAMLLNKLRNEKGITQIDVIVSDGSPSLHDPLKQFYPDTLKQRCVLHIVRKLKHSMSKFQEIKLIPLIMSIFRCNSKEEGWARWRQVKMLLENDNTRVYQQLKKTIESMMHFYDLPRSLWRSCYTNNICENFNSCFRRFSPSNTCFSSLASVELTLSLTKIKLNATYKSYDLNLF